jgi:hypothetical protein
MMAIPKRIEEILEEQLQEKNASTLPMEPAEAEAPAEDEQSEDKEQEAPNEDQGDSGNQSKGFNLSLNIPRTYLNVATPANPVSASKGEQRLVKLVNELIPAKEANTDEDGFAMQEFIRNNIQTSTSWQ